jgi:hypothetical protein
VLLRKALTYLSDEQRARYSTMEGSEAAATGEAG